MRPGHLCAGRFVYRLSFRLSAGIYPRLSFRPKARSAEVEKSISEARIRRDFSARSRCSLGRNDISAGIYPRLSFRPKARSAEVEKSISEARIRRDFSARSRCSLGRNDISKMSLEEFSTCVCTEKTPIYEANADRCAHTRYGRAKGHLPSRSASIIA